MNRKLYECEDGQPCDYCGQQESKERGPVYYQNQGCYHAACVEPAKYEARCYERDRRAHSQLMDMAAGYGD